MNRQDTGALWADLLVFWLSVMLMIPAGFVWGVAGGGEAGCVLALLVAVRFWRLSRRLDGKR